MSDTMREMDVHTQGEGDGLARTISVAGLQVSQAADELQQAAEKLMAAEVASREAEMRWKAAEEQLAQGATKNAELLEMLQRAREGQTEADERTRRADQRLQITIERARLLEEQIKELEGRVVEAESRPQVTVVLDDERTALQEAVAAEVRRPLTSILGLALAMKHADPKSSEGKDMIRQLSTNARKLDRLVGEMLSLDEIVSGTFQPNLRRTDVEALVRRVVEESPDLANRDVIVEADHVALEVDPALVEQMVETLLANAGRRTAPGNPVWVKVSSGQGGAVIAVDDTGPEVPSGLRGAMVAALTDSGPAARSNRPRGATGLSLLARLAEIHGGRAWVEERPGGGASFRVYLPLRREASEGSVEERVAARADVELPPAPVEEEPAASTSIEDRLRGRVRDLSDERAMALAKALIAADDDTDATFEVPALSMNGNGHHKLEDLGGFEGEIRF